MKHARRAFRISAMTVLLLCLLLSCSPPAAIPDPGYASVTVLLDGNATALHTGATVPFGDVVWDYQTVLSFTIKNFGTAPLQLTSPGRVSIGGLNPDAFSLTQAPEATVPANGGTTSFSITFAPSNIGSKAAIVSIKTNVTDTQSISFMVAGTGIKGWRNVGGAGFSAGPADSVSLALDASNGTPYVAYLDQSLGAFPQPQVRKLTAGSWSVLGDPRVPLYPGEYSSTSLAFYSGLPYLAYSFDNVGFCVRDVYYDSGTWIVDGTGDTGGTMPKNYLSLKENINGELWLVYRDNYGFAGVPGSASVAIKGIVWTIAFQNFTPQAASYLDLAFFRNSSGAIIPCVGYKDDVSQKANVYDLLNGSPYGSINFSDGTADYTSLEVDSSGALYIAYRDGAQAGKVTVMKNDGVNDWTAVGVKGFTAGAATYISLARDMDDTLYIAYSDASKAGKLTVERFNGASWEVVGLPGSSAGTAASISLVCSGSTPYVAFKDGSAGGKVTVMKLE